ncbi:MAG: SH3 domain-containing protein [Lamprocystis purpurea]|jgi:hypothetical protein|uniref:SH3 domain-containing protein n=1 Tax=Lamprocystis purpurea TaxID=61598 RepID=UPI000361AED3|nr:SH3 domain-containing protein [Lamprocystis purpurea]MBV5272529.1 SH3 domain-containing protein [Lamprocystis purpurea]
MSTQGKDKWRVATSLLTLRNQINSLYPARKKASDGTIGDSRHCGGSGTSDHCARDLGGSVKVVTAMDITHDPASGCDAGRIVSALVASRDERIKYIIWNKRILSSEVSAWTWRSYNGSNPHSKHFHLSVVPKMSLFDSTAPWQLSPASTSTTISRPVPSGNRYKVIARSGLRLREGAGTQFDAIGRLSPGQVVVVTATEGDWYEIDAEGDGFRDGFCYGAFLVQVS